jgi:hypothetical protein
MDLAIQEREADLVIGTFGRALWVLDDIRPLRKIAKNGLKSLEQRIVAFDVPDAYMAQMKEPIGYWSGGEGLYEADNRSRAARLSFFVKVPAKADSTKSAAKTALATTTAKATEGAKAGRDSVFVTIFDENNKLIRKLRHLPDSTGIHRLLWNLDEESTMRMPGSPRPRARTSEGPANDMMSFMMRRAGAQAIPGKYKIVLKYADAKDSTSLSLLPDPRIPYNKEATLAKRQLTDRINQSTQKLTDAVDKLDDAKEVTDKLLVQLKDQDSKEMKDMEKRVKAMQDTLKAKRDIIIARPSEKQGISRSSRVTAQTKLMESLIYARSKPEITTAETRLVENLETMTKEATDKIENIFGTQWADFRKYVEANPVKLFK